MLVSIAIVFGLINTVFRLINIKAFLALAVLSSPVVNAISLLLPVIGLAILITLFFKLYNIAPDLIKWVNIAFGYLIFEIIFGTIVGLFSFKLFTSELSIMLLMLMPLIIFLAIIIVVWFTFVNHLKKAQRENLMNFS